MSDDVGPTVVWGSSVQAVNYSVTILNTGCASLCATANTTSLNYGYNNSCNLNDGSNYQARGVANKSGGLTTSRLYSFSTDFSPPAVSVQAPILTSDDGGATTNIKFAVSDLYSGVADAVCYRTYNGVTSSYPCLNKTALLLTNLGIGNHSFYIRATDKVGHATISQTVSWSVKAVVCDPFSTGSSGLCKKGLQGPIYYVSSAGRAKEDSYVRNTYVGPPQQVGTASTGASTLIISNDGAHSTQLGCVASGSSYRRIKFDINIRLPMRIDYYQGPAPENFMTDETN